MSENKELDINDYNELSIQAEPYFITITDESEIESYNKILAEGPPEGYNWHPSYEHYLRECAAGRNYICYDGPIYERCSEGNKICNIRVLPSNIIKATNLPDQFQGFTFECEPVKELGIAKLAEVVKEIKGQQNENTL